MSTIKDRVQEIFDRFAVSLSVDEVKMATATLDSGQQIQTDAEAFASGASVFVVNDEGERIPLPDGDYTLEDGTKIKVLEGVVAQEDTEEEPTSETPAEDEEAMASEDAPVEEVQETLSKQDVADMIKEALAPIMEALEKQSEVTENLSKQSAEQSLPRVKKAPKAMPKVDLSGMTLMERVNAIHAQHSHHG